MWAFNFEEGEWSPVNLMSGELDSNVVPPARFDHSAVVMESPIVPGAMVMVIYGGRSGNHFLGDMWEYSFDNRTWRQLAKSGDLPPGNRFGHTAAATASG